MKKITEVKRTHEVGKCGYCKSENLDYSSMVPEDNMVHYEFLCLDCKSFGVEWYNLNYIETITSKMEA